MNTLGIFFLAFLVESFTEYTLGSVDRAKPYLRYVALALGVGAAIAYNVDILSSVAGLTSPAPFVGQVISGLIIGRGSNFVNDVISMIRGEEKTVEKSNQ